MQDAVALVSPALLDDLRPLAADDMNAFVEHAAVELLVALSVGADVDVELVDLGAGPVLDKVGELESVHAADPRAVAVMVLISRANAVDNGDGPGLPPVLEADRKSVV